MTTGTVPTASFRYIGDTTSVKDGRVIVIATHLDKTENKVYAGVALTRPNARYDKYFMRALAVYRMRTFMATHGQLDTALASRAEDELRIDLINVRPRVKKTCEVTKLSHEEYVALRSQFANASETNPANIGYKKTVTTYFEVEDFSNTVEPYSFVIDVEEDAGHMDIDEEIFGCMILEGTYPKWVNRLLASACADIEDARENAEDMEEVTVAEINESFTDMHIVHNTFHGWYLAKEAGSPVCDALSPVCVTREELTKWFTRIPAILEDMQETEVEEESTETPTYFDDGDDDDSDEDGDVDPDSDDDDDTDDEESAFDVDAEATDSEDEDEIEDEK